MNFHEAAADLFAINAEIKKLTKAADQLKDMFKAHGNFTNSEYEVSVRTTDRTTIDTAELRKKYPTIAEECSRVTEVVSVSVKKV